MAENSTRASLEPEPAALKQKLLTMAERVESMVNRAIKGLLMHHPDLARGIKERDNEVDFFEKKIDELALNLLGQTTDPAELRLLVVAMKISRDLERVVDAATTIARRAQALTQSTFPATPVDRLAIWLPALGVLQEAFACCRAH